MVLVIREDTLTVFFKRFAGICILAPPGGEWFPGRDAAHLPAQQFCGDLRMAIEVHPAHSQQGAIVDFESNGERSIPRLLTRDCDARLRVAQLIQTGANREGNPLKRRWIGWFSKAWREFFVFEHFFDLFLREQPRA